MESRLNSILDDIPDIIGWPTRRIELDSLRARNEHARATSRQEDVRPEPRWATECDQWAEIADYAEAQKSSKAKASAPARGPSLHSLNPLAPAALYGPIGDYVKALAPDTEASPAGILAATITTIGCMLGRRPHCLIEGAEHHARFMTVLVGPSSTGRKGTAMHHGITQVIAAVDPLFNERTASGLSSAEGLVVCVRDATAEGDSADGKGDSGVADKRLLIKQGEFAGVLKVMEREGNALSPRLREAWDGDTLQVMTRKSPLVATAPHICLIAAITPSELARSLKSAEVSNGLANRFLVFWCEREQFLPFGGTAGHAEVTLALDALRHAYRRAQTIGRVGWTDAGGAWWQRHYAALSTPAVGGSLGTLLARGAPMVQRLALLFAVMDGRHERDARHCDAALAVWDYVEGTWRALYATADALSDRATKVLAVLDAAGPEGVKKSDKVRLLNSGNVSADDVDAVLTELREAGLARPHTRPGKGRPAEVWVSTRNLSASRNGQNGFSDAESMAEAPIQTKTTIPPDVGASLQTIGDDGPPGLEVIDYEPLEDLSVDDMNFADAA